MTVAGYNCKISVSHTGTAVVDEACVLLSGSGTTKIFQVTDSAKRIWDPTVPVVVEIAGVPQAATAFRFNYLFGRVMFLTVDPGASAVTVTGTYLATLEIANASEFSLTLQRVLQNDPRFQLDYMRRVATLKDASLSFSLKEDSLAAGDGGQDWDTGGGTLVLWQLLNNGTPKLVQVDMGSQVFRGWFLLESQDKGGAVEELVGDSFQAQAAPQPGSGAGAIATFSFVDQNIP